MKKYFSWEHYQTLVEELYRQITPSPDIIVSIGKGGSIPGVILAELYNCNNLNFGLKSYDGQTQGSIHEYQSPPCYNSLRDLNILIIDDIADSGKTFKYAVNKFKGNGCEKVITASIFYKNCSSFKPDYFAYEENENTWIVQPWEKFD